MNGPNQAEIDSVKLLKRIDEKMAVANRVRVHVEFIKGIIYGIGFAIGTTILFGLMIWFLRQFLTVPVVGEYVKQVVEFVQDSSSRL